MDDSEHHPTPATCPRADLCMKVAYAMANGARPQPERHALPQAPVGKPQAIPEVGSPEDPAAMLDRAEQIGNQVGDEQATMDAQLDAPLAEGEEGVTMFARQLVERARQAGRKMTFQQALEIVESGRAAEFLKSLESPGGEVYMRPRFDPGMSKEDRALLIAESYRKAGRPITFDAAYDLAR